MSAAAEELVGELTVVKPFYLTVEEYIANEDGSDVRHEYLGGMVYAMAGASRAHNLIAGAFYSAIRQHLRGKACNVFISDVKVQMMISDRAVFYYPDVVVSCDPRDKGSNAIEHPSVVIEVLSDSTENTDRREKFWNYTQIENLAEYVLVSQDRREVTVFRRKDKWAPVTSKAAGGIVELIAIGLSLPLDAIYADVI